MFPRLVINLNKFEYNLKAAREKLRDHDMTFMFVTKGILAMPELCSAALPYVDYFGDSRIMNLARLPEGKPRVLIRIPMPGEAELTVKHAHMSLNSELTTVRAINEAAGRLGVEHGVILMADLGDLREGYFSLDEMLRDAAIIKAMEHVRVVGIGVNLSCFCGVMPSYGKMETLIKWAGALEDCLGHKLDIISGGTSSSLRLLEEESMPWGINNLRLGESILCGCDPSTWEMYEGMTGGVFTLESEIVELKEKPSAPVGEVGFDAFGELLPVVDMGWRRRAILAVGRQDIDSDSLTPLDKGMTILGASSDHLITDVHDSAVLYKVGDAAAFDVSYPSILRACTSPYVEKVFIGGDDMEEGHGRY